MLTRPCSCSSAALCLPFQPEQKSVLSSLDADSPPLGLQKTFIFPRPVTCLGSTNTARGIASKVQPAPHRSKPFDHHVG